MDPEKFKLGGSLHGEKIATKLGEGGVADGGSVPLSGRKSVECLLSPE